MLGRSTYTAAELDHARTMIADQLAAYDVLAAALPAKGQAAQDAFEPLFFNNLALALDRCFVHRVRGVTGKDGNPLNELERICECLMNDGGVLTDIKAVKLVPETSVTGIAFGDEIHLTADQFRRLSDAFLHEIETRFLA